MGLAKAGVGVRGLQIDLVQELTGHPGCLGLECDPVALKFAAFCGYLQLKPGFGLQFAVLLHAEPMAGRHNQLVFHAQGQGCHHFIADLGERDRFWGVFELAVGDFGQISHFVGPFRGLGSTFPRQFGSFRPWGCPVFEHKRGTFRPVRRAKIGCVASFLRVCNVCMCIVRGFLIFG